VIAESRRKILLLEEKREKKKKKNGFATEREGRNTRKRS